MEQETLKSIMNNERIFFMDYFLDTLDVILRSVTSIIFLFFITRLMGRKQISQLSFFDYIIGISIGSIAAEMATSQQVPYLHGFLGMLIYALIAIGISLVTNKSIKFRRFINGRTYLLIEKGKILDRNLTKVKYDVNDLLAEARYSGYFNIADIEYALMEASGRISFMPKAAKTNVVQEDINLQKAQEGLVANIIIDGEIMKDNLLHTGLNEAWLRKHLEEQGYDSEKEIILATVDIDNNLSIYEKSNKTVQQTVID